MSDEIKEIISYLKNKTFIPDETKRKYKILHRDEVNKLLDYITNLQQAFENSYTEEQLDFAVNEVKEQLKAEHQLTNQLHNEIDKLRVKNYELQQEKENYKSRCKKVVERIEPLVEWGECTINGKILKEIYNILQGENNEK